MNTKLAQIFGNVQPPPGVNKYVGPTQFISNIVKLLIVGAGIYALFNLVTAGYAFTKLKSAYIPAPTIKSFTMLLINWVGPTYLLTPGGGCTFPNICASLVFM